MGIGKNHGAGHLQDEDLVPYQDNSNGHNGDGPTFTNPRNAMDGNT